MRGSRPAEIPGARVPPLQHPHFPNRNRAAKGLPGMHGRPPHEGRPHDTLLVFSRRLGGFWGVAHCTGSLSAGRRAGRNAVPWRDAAGIDLLSWSSSTSWWLSFLEWDGKRNGTQKKKKIIGGAVYYVVVP
ncbi:unnamed protein product [Calypogeia fissa]